MPRRIKGPDGVTHLFPDDATDQEIASVLETLQQPTSPPASESPKNPTWSDSLGLNEPTDSMATGFLRGAGGAAVDMAQGATARVRNAVAKGGDPAMRQVLGAAPVEQQQDVMQAPETFAGKVGSVVPDVAALAVPAGGAAKAAYQAIPRTARAAEKFKDVMGAARNIPVDVSEVGNVALRINQLAERGGSMPMAVRKILNRMTDPNKAPMAYEEARDFASNISRLSADEFGRLTPVVAREVATLRVALNKANAMAAKQAGKLEEYHSAMLEYARAMRVKNIIDSAVQGVKKAAPYATVAGGGYWLSKRLGSLIDQ